MSFVFVPWYIYHILTVLWQILLIIGSLKLRKTNENFRSGTYLLVSGLVVISIRIFYVLSSLFLWEFGYYSYTIIPLIISFLQLTVLGIFFIFIGTKNKQLEGKWLLRAGIIYCIASLIQIYIYLYLIYKCIIINGESSIMFYVCIADSYAGGLAYLQLIFSMIYVVSYLFFLIFSKKLKQKYILYAATILFCSYLFFLINDIIPGILNWLLY
jgi:hypothetical protein